MVYCLRKILISALSGPGGTEETIMEVDIHHNRDQKARSKQLKSQEFYLRLWSSCTGFRSDEPIPRSTKWCCRGCSWVIPIGHLCPLPLWSRRWSFLDGRANLLLLQDLQLMTCRCRRCPSCGCVLFMRAATRANSLRTMARSSPSSSWLWNSQRATAPSCFLVLGQGPKGSQAFSQGTRNPSQVHQTLPTLQGPEDWARKRPTGLT